MRNFTVVGLVLAEDKSACKVAGVWEGDLGPSGFYSPEPGYHRFALALTAMSSEDAAEQYRARVRNGAFIAHTEPA